MKILDIDKISVGDNVGFYDMSTYGYGRFFKVYKIGKVTKITPKRTKIWIDDKEQKTDSILIYEIDEDFKNEVIRTNELKKLNNNLYALYKITKTSEHVIEKHKTTDYEKLTDINAKIQELIVLITEE